MKIVQSNLSAVPYTTTSICGNVQDKEFLRQIKTEISAIKTLILEKQN